MITAEEILARADARRGKIESAAQLVGKAVKSVDDASAWAALDVALSALDADGAALADEGDGPAEHVAKQKIRELMREQEHLAALTVSDGDFQGQRGALLVAAEMELLSMRKVLARLKGAK
jgi:hypothetical protein